MTTHVDIPSAPRVAVVPGRSEAASETRAPSPWWRLAPVLVASAFAVAYLIVQPRTVDLAASVFRSRLFGEAPWTIWNNSWYSGHPTLSYSVLVPALAWVLSPALLAALATVLSAALFEPLARGWFGSTASRWGALWFGAGAATPMLSGRVTFAAAVPAALGALLAVQRARPWLGVLLAVLAGLLSPVVALFLAFAGVAYALSGARRLGGSPSKPLAAGRLRHALRDPRLAGLAIAVAAAAPPGLVALAFPDGGEGPFVFSAFWPVPLFALAFALLVPARERALRIGAGLYGLAAIADWAVSNPFGGNVVRLGALFGGPLLLCALQAAGRRRIGPLAIALLLAFGVWQWSASVRDVAQTWGDRATEASFYAPLNDFLTRADDGQPFRVEIPFTFSHWETAEVSPRFALARGWLRPDDVDYNHLFYGGRLDADSYRHWLADHGVRFVAVPVGVKPDYSARRELDLIASGLPYLRPAFRTPDWRVYEVAQPRAMALGSAQVVRLGIDDATLRFPQPGSALVRIRWSPYWRAAGACVEQAGDWTRVVSRQAGEIELEQDFSLGRLIDHGRRCA